MVHDNPYSSNFDFQIQRFHNPFGPNFVALGAFWGSPGWSVFGKGVTEQDAIVSLFGEATETLALIKARDQTTGLFYDPTTSQTQPRTVFTPHRTTSLYSHGCAAHISDELAQQSAILELFERKAVYDWWSERKSAQSLDVDQHMVGLSRWIESLRHTARWHRDTTFFRLPSIPGVIVVGAVSFGHGISSPAIGFAAGLSFENAIKRAFLEVMAAELETAELIAAMQEGVNVETDDRSSKTLALQTALQTSEKKLWLDLEQGGWGNVSPKPIWILADQANAKVLLRDLSHPDLVGRVWQAEFEDPQLMPLFEFGSKPAPL